MWQQRPVGKGTENDLALFYREVEIAFPQLSSAGSTEVKQKLSEDRAKSSLQPFECFIKRYVVDASSNIVHEVAVWIAATTHTRHFDKLLKRWWAL